MNLANDTTYFEEINQLKKHIPQKNAIWDVNSSYTFQPFFREQKERTNGKPLKETEIIDADR